MSGVRVPTKLFYRGDGEERRWFMLRGAYQRRDGEPFETYLLYDVSDAAHYPPLYRVRVRFNRRAIERIAS